jgi:intracellular septation protein
MKFLFDLFPVILFFVAFKIWGIYTATAVTIAATVCQIIWMAVRHRRVEPMLWVSFAIVVVFGGATLLLHDENFIKWKPTVLYWAFAIALGIAHLLKKSPIQAMMGKQMTLPAPVWRQLNLAWAVFFIVLGILNLIIAFHFSTDAWVNYKLFGGTALMIVFVIGQSIWLSRYLKSE